MTDDNDEHCPADVTTDQVEAYLGRILDADAFSRWWATPVPALGGRTPRDAFVTREGRLAVLAVVRSYVERPTFS